MSTKRLGIIMHGVTGRMGMNQHLIRSIVAIRKQGGVTLSDGNRVMPDPILVGRNLDKVARLAKAHGIERYTDDLDAALKNKDDTLFFDAATTQARAGLLKKAMAAGKDVYCEKPTAEKLTAMARISQTGAMATPGTGALAATTSMPSAGRPLVTREPAGDWKEKAWP